MLSVTLLLAASTAQPVVTTDVQPTAQQQRALRMGDMLFDRSDSDGDGQLTRAEMAKTLRMASLVVRDKELSQGTMDERIDAVLAEQDRDKNGKLSRAEMRRLILSRIDK
ncbi:EF-hand domain-containing protein [Sphingomicrobium sp. XHP0235]|uniref:EF-hand domain-containing protein n=1 Tax=Sphingomicrobium aquimarinum TaxID=3133971 RepID=UPI0031FEB0F6